MKIQHVPSVPGTRLRILVTGASGMLGRALVKRLSVRHEVVGTSKSGRENSIPCDLTNEKEVLALVESRPFDVLIHTAAYSDVDGCERDPEQAHRTNALGTRFLAQAAGRKRSPFIYISTDYVFDGTGNAPYLETDETGPVNIYGMTKLEGEYFALRYAPAAVIVRTSWLFGHGNPQNFVNAIVERLKTQPRVQVLQDQEDAPTYVEDLAACLEKITLWARGETAPNPARPLRETLHVCNAGSTTRLGMALKIREIMGLENVEVSALDASQIENRLAIRPARAVLSTKRYENQFHDSLRPWQESLNEYLTGRVLCAS